MAYEWKDSSGGPVNVNDHHRREVADMLTAKLDAAKRMHAKRLNADIYGSIARRREPAPTRTWRDYFKTLGRALRGEDPYEDVY